MIREFIEQRNANQGDPVIVCLVPSTPKMINCYEIASFIEEDEFFLKLSVYKNEYKRNQTNPTKETIINKRNILTFV